MERLPGVMSNTYEPSIAPRIHSKELRWTGVPLNQKVGPQRYWTSVYPIENSQAHKLNIEGTSESTRLRENS